MKSGTLIREVCTGEALDILHNSIRWDEPLFIVMKFHDPFRSFVVRSQTNSSLFFRDHLNMSSEIDCVSCIGERCISRMAFGCERLVVQVVVESISHKKPRDMIEGEGVEALNYLIEQMTLKKDGSSGASHDEESLS